MLSLAYLILTKNVLLMSLSCAVCIALGGVHKLRLQNLAFLDHLPPSFYIFYGIKVKVHFFDHLPLSSCKRSLWTPPYKNMSNDFKVTVPVSRYIPIQMLWLIVYHLKKIGNSHSYSVMIVLCKLGSVYLEIEKGILYLLKNWLALN